MWRLGNMSMLLVAVGCGGLEESVSEVGPVEVELFGEGAVSTEFPEFAITFSPDGDTAYFNRTPPDRSKLDLMVSVRARGVWTAAVPFMPTIDIAAIDPFMTSSGSRLYFSSSLTERDSLPGPFNIWFMDRTSEGWSPPQPLPAPIRSESSDVFNSFTDEGTMVFSSTRSGARRVYSSSVTDDGWQEPTLLRFSELTEASNPMISRDGSYIVISSMGADGAPDLFVSCKQGSTWGSPIALPSPINSEYAEFAPAIFGGSLYFTSERPGVVGELADSVRPPGDIYRTDLRNAMAVCEPLNSTPDG